MADLPSSERPPGLISRLGEVAIEIVLRVHRWDSALARLAIRGLSRLVQGRMMDHRVSALGGVDSWQWTERGIVARHNARAGDVVLDIACGDGVYDAKFLADRVRRIDAVDLNPAAIAAANRRYRRDNIRFLVLDAIAQPFPEPRYDLVICFATFQYFTLEQAHQLLGKIAAALPDAGRFVGMLPNYSAGINDPGAAVNYRSAEQIRTLLEPHFAQVELVTSPVTPNRTDVFFVCRQPRPADAQQVAQAIAALQVTVAGK